MHINWILIYVFLFFYICIFFGREEIQSLKVNWMWGDGVVVRGARTLHLTNNNSYRMLRERTSLFCPSNAKLYEFIALTCRSFPILTKILEERKKKAS